MIGKIIKNLRIKKGYTLGQIAKWSGINKGLLSRYENGLVSVNSKQLDKIAIGLRVNPILFYVIWMRLQYFSNLTPEHEIVKIFNELEEILKESRGKK